MKKVFVLDTSVLLRDSTEIFRFEDNEVVFPFTVLEELENKGRQLDDVGRLAWQSICYLHQLREGGQISQGVNLPGEGRLRIEFNHSSENHCRFFLTSLGRQSYFGGFTEFSA